MKDVNIYAVSESKLGERETLKIMVSDGIHLYNSSVCCGMYAVSGHRLCANDRVDGDSTLGRRVLSLCGPSDALMLAEDEFSVYVIPVPVDDAGHFPDGTLMIDGVATMVDLGPYRYQGTVYIGMDTLLAKVHGIVDKWLEYARAVPEGAELAEAVRQARLADREKYGAPSALHDMVSAFGQAFSGHIKL